MIDSNPLVAALEHAIAELDEHADADYSDTAGSAVPNWAMVLRDELTAVVRKAKP